MLRFFRGEGVTQAFVGAIVVAIIIVFVIQFRAGTGPTAELARECAVETASSCLTEKDFLGAYGLVVPRGLTPKQTRQLDLRKVVLHGLAERELLVEEAARLGISASDDEVDDELAKGRFRVSVPAASHALEGTLRLLDGIRLVPVSKSGKNAEFDFKVYERQVRNYTNRSPREFKESQERELLAARMRDLVRARVQIPESEVYGEFERDRSKCVARVVALERDWFSKYALTISEQEVENWALEHKGEVDAAWTAAQTKWKEGCPLVSEIRVDIPPASADEDKVILRDRIARAKTRLDRGEAFEDVARETSDAENAHTGGQLGCLDESYGTGAETVLKALTTLAPGKVSDVLESPAGFHLVRFEGKLEKAELEKHGRHHVARVLARQAAANAILGRFAKALLDGAKTGKPLEELTNALALEFTPRRTTAQAGGKKLDPKEEPPWLDASRPKVEITPPFSVMSNPVLDAAPTEAVAAKVFALANPGDVLPDPVPTSRGVAVVQLKEKELAKREDFDKDKSRIVSAVRAAKAQESLVNYVSRLRRSAGERLRLNPRFLEAPKSADEGPGGPEDG